MEFDKQLKLGHLLLVDRKCRTCGEEKNLIDGLKEKQEMSMVICHICGNICNNGI